MSKHQIIYDFVRGSTIQQISKRYARLEKTSVKSAREDVERVIYEYQMSQPLDKL